MKHILIINVLAKKQFDDCRIKGSISVPIDELGEFAQNLDKDQKIVVYCANYACKASRDAWHLLHDMGFKDIYAYEGGIAEWHQKGYPTDGACQMEYLEKPFEEPEGEGRVRQISAEDLRALME